MGDVLAEVESGRAHIAAAGLTRGQALPPRVRFGPPYQQVKEQLVFRMGNPRPRTLRTIVAGRELMRDGAVIGFDPRHATRVEEAASRLRRWRESQSKV